MTGAYDKDTARQFAENWLPAWTGNNPGKLAAFYTEDAFYSDPTLPNGVQGKAGLLHYFSKLLSDNPDWIWTHTGSIPLKNGFVNEWHASVPVGEKIIEIDGICLVQLRDSLIYRNQVYFDTLELITEISHHNNRKRSAGAS